MIIVVVIIIIIIVIIAIIIIIKQHHHPLSSLPFRHLFLLSEESQIISHRWPGCWLLFLYGLTTSKAGEEGKAEDDHEEEEAEEEEEEEEEESYIGEYPQFHGFHMAAPVSCGGKNGDDNDVDDQHLGGCR